MELVELLQKRMVECENRLGYEVASFGKLDNSLTERIAMEEVTVTTGQRVAYVMRDGTTRPLDIVRVWPSGPHPGSCNGVLLIDGKNDQDNLPICLGKNDKEEDVFLSLPTARQTVATGDEYPLCAIWVTSAHYSEGKEPGTYHFAEDDADAVDVAGLQGRVDELEKIVRKLTAKQSKPQVETPAPDAKILGADAAVPGTGKTVTNETKDAGKYSV